MTEKRERKYYSVSKSLARNAISALLSAIELYNKPNLSYRNETVVILLSHAWEILLKAVLYKNKNKLVKCYIQESLKDEDTQDNVGFLKVTELYCTWKDKTLLKEHLTFLRKTRNKVMHAYIFPKEVESILWWLFQKSYELFDEILEKEFDGLKISFDFPFILPIWLKKPYDKSLFLEWIGTREIPLLNDLLESSKRLSEGNIDETIIVPVIFSYDKTSKVSNADIVVAIDPDEPKKIDITKGIRLVHNATTLHTPINPEGFRKKFKLVPKDIRKEFKIGCKSTINWNLVYKEVNNEKNHEIYWWVDPKTHRKYFSEEGKKEIERLLKLASESAKDSVNKE